LQHLNTFAKRLRTAPDGVFGVEANTAGETSYEIGPHTPVLQAAAGHDIEGRSLLPQDSADQR
jgi:hypothetical protein